MKKFFTLISFVFLLISCSNNESNSDSQLFRNNFNNTSWIDSDGSIFTFNTEKLFYVKDNTSSLYYKVGTYNNISYDACVYNTVNNVIVSEDSNSFTIRQVTSSGVGSNCPPTSVILTFKVLNENTIETITNYDGNINSFIINRTNSISTLNAIDGTAAGFLW